MASSSQVALSPAELAYLHASLSQTPPIRPDGRRAGQFRALSAETGILPGTNGSARVCFADGTEAIVGVKAEIEKTVPSIHDDHGEKGQTERGEEEGRGGEESEDKRVGKGEWAEMMIEIPGVRDDDVGTAFLESMLREALLADGELARKLCINRRFHWRLYLDILLISPPLSYPLPLLSLTTHLALLSTRLPRLKSEGDEDPMFDDDWQVSHYLYPPRNNNTVKSNTTTNKNNKESRPPITLLLAAVGENILFDPTKEELAVAESVLAVSVVECQDDDDSGKRRARMCSMRMVNLPARKTAPGVPSGVAAGQGQAADDTVRVEGLWRAPLGGTRIEMIERMVDAVLKPGGGADEVLGGLEGVELS